MTPGERDRLIDDLLEGELSEADFLRLEAEMIVDEEARRAYYLRQKLQTGLSLEAAEYFGGGKEGEAPALSGGPRRRFRIDGLLLAAAGAFALLVGVLGWRIGQDTERAARGPEPVASGFGVIAAPVGGAWSDGIALREGDLVPGGELSLASGVASIELFSGVKLLVTGPARFTVRSGMEVALAEGRVQFRVPPVARGFRVVGAPGEVDAEAAEFALNRTSEATELQVLEGTVEWRGQDASASLEGGEGIRRSAAGSFSPIQVRTVSMEETRARLAAERSGRFARWQERAEELVADPALLLHLALGEADKAASVGSTTIRTMPATDRWGRPGGALDFSPTGSRVRVDVPGEHESLSLMCWVRIDGLDRWYNSLFLTDGHELHEPHWQIMEDGRLFFSVRSRDQKGEKDKHISYSPPVWTPARSGQWMHLATVYDGAAQTVSHFRDGELLVLEPLPEEFHPARVVIGPASVGNWSEPKYRSDAEFVMRNLNGAIDELWVLGRALEAEEVAAVCEEGRP